MTSQAMGGGAAGWNEARAAGSARMTGVAAIALAVAFNVPFSVLGAIYDYPDILRRPAAEALEKFAVGGPVLILTWHAFLLCALALAVMAPMLAVSQRRLAERPALAVGAAVIGALAGLAQAIGLSRWVFAVPALAQSGGTEAFDLLNAWGGVAIGEHIGQLLTAAFVLQVAMLQAGEGRRIAAPIGFLSGVLLIAGSGEGLALAVGAPGELFSLTTIAGFVGLTLWLIATGVGLIRGR